MTRGSLFRDKGPWILVYTETFPTRALAMKRERQLKKWNRKSIQKLLNSYR
ncbi:MAG: GIY-YIG nuclease family protein [Fidelibacterota bacterium]